jgi:hypothetical protein
MSQKRDKPTQKEVIFKIILGRLGTRYRAGFDCRQLLYGPNRKGYGRRVFDSEDLDEIRTKISAGLRNGDVPSKKSEQWAKAPIKKTPSYSGLRDYDPAEEYANRIMHYWLKNDSRLNGSAPVSRKDFLRFPLHRYENLKSKDTRLQALRGLLHNEMVRTGKSDELLEVHLQRRILELLLAAFGVRVEDLPAKIQKDLQIASRGRKAA